MTKPQEKLINFNYAKYAQDYCESIKMLLKYAYPNDEFKATAGHTAIQMSQTVISCHYRLLDNLLSNDNSDNNNMDKNTLLKNILSYTKIVNKNLYNKLEESYPDNLYKESIAHLKISQGFTMNTDLKLFVENFADITPSIQIEPMKTFSLMFKYQNIINRAYPDNKYSGDRAHEALQRIRQLSFHIFSFIKNLIESNTPEKNDFKSESNINSEQLSFLSNLKTHVSELTDIVLIAYPNDALDTQLGHSAFTAASKKIKLIEQYTLDNVHIFSNGKKNQKEVEFLEKEDKEMKEEIISDNKINFKF